MPAISRVVATGRRMKIRDGLIATSARRCRFFSYSYLLRIAALAVLAALLVLPTLAACHIDGRDRNQPTPKQACPIDSPPWFLRCRGDPASEAASA